MRSAPLLFFAILVCWCPVSWAALPAHVEARSAILVEMGTGVVLFEQDADLKIPPASLTKLMTLYLAHEDMESHKASLESLVSIGPKSTSAGGSSMHLRPGETVTFGELLAGMAVASGNDASVAVARFLGKTVEKFVKRMNDTAEDLGLKDTVFKTPNGLPVEGQLTTARDMALLSAAYVTRFPSALKLHSIKDLQHNGMVVSNTNKLLDSFPGVDGLKTGYVAASRYNFSVTAQRDDVRLLAVILGAETKAIRFREAEKLLEGGFAAIREYTYTVQVGSWNSAGKAQEKMNVLSSNGIPVRLDEYRSPEGRKLFRVLTGLFDSFESATAYKRKLASERGISSSYILHRTEHRGRVLLKPVFSP